MAVDPNAPHDSLVKELLGSAGDAAAVLDTVLPYGVRAAIDWTSLEREDGEVAAKRDASTHTDLLFRARARVGGDSHEIKILIVIEHQSTPDWTMPARMLGSVNGLWRRALRRHGGEPLPLILPVLLSHTVGGWRTSRRLADMFATDPALLGLDRWTPTFELLIIDLTATQHDELLGWAESLVARGAIAQGTMLLCLAAVGELGDPASHVDRTLCHAAPWLETLLGTDREQVKTLLVYLAVTTRLTGAELAAMLSTHGATKVASTLETLREMWRQLEREEGRDQGLVEGRRHTLVATVNRLLTLKFGSLTDEQVRSIEHAHEARLEVFLERVLTADSIEAVLAPE